MFDVGFWELALIGVVALLVVGPDRLPALARTVGIWVGRIRRYATVVRDDIEREIRAEELKEMLDESKDLGQLSEVVEETQTTLGQARAEIQQVGEESERIAASDEQPTVNAPGPDSSRVAGDTGDVVAPGDAATTVAESVSARSNSPAEAVEKSSEDAPDESVTSTSGTGESDERRPR